MSRHLHLSLEPERRDNFGWIVRIYYNTHPHANIRQNMKWKQQNYGSNETPDNKIDFVYLWEETHEKTTTKNKRRRRNDWNCLIVVVVVVADGVDPLQVLEMVFFSLWLCLFFFFFFSLIFAVSAVVDCSSSSSFSLWCFFVFIFKWWARPMWRTSQSLRSNYNTK